MKILKSLGAMVLALALVLGCVPFSVHAYDETEYIFLDDDSVVYARGYVNADGSWTDPVETGYYSFEDPFSINVNAGLSSNASKVGGYGYIVVHVPLSSSLQYKISQAESVSISYCFYRNADKAALGSYIQVGGTTKTGYFDAYVNNHFVGAYANTDNSGLVYTDLKVESGHGLGTPSGWTFSGDAYTGSSWNTGYLYLKSRGPTSVTSNFDFDALEIRTTSQLTFRDKNGNAIPYSASQGGAAYIYYTGFVMTITCHYPDQQSAMIAAVGSQGSSLADIAAAVSNAANSVNANISTSTIQITGAIDSAADRITGSIDIAVDEIGSKIDGAAETLEAAINGDGYDEEKLSGALDDLSDSVNELESKEEIFEDFVSENLALPTLEPSAAEMNGFTWVIAQINSIWTALSPVHILFYTLFFFFAVGLLLFG